MPLSSALSHGLGFFWLIGHVKYSPVNLYAPRVLAAHAVMKTTIFKEKGNEETTPLSEIRTTHRQREKFILIELKK